MKPTEERTVDDRDVVVFDDLLTKAQVNAVQAMFVQIPFARTRSFDGELNYGLTPEEFAQFPHLPAVLDSLFDSLRARFGVHARDVGFGHAYAAVFHPNDEPVRHTDGQTSQALSFVYYANPIWDPRWGGETLFFGADARVAATIAPRPGRVVAFPANLLHQAGVPRPNAPLLRHTISAFYYAAQERETLIGSES